MRFLSLFLLVTAGFGVSTQPFSCYPRMHDQPSILPFERKMPEAPPGQVPFSGPVGLPLTKGQAAAMTNPAEATPESVSRGRLYYGYYCEMCHATDGRGAGAVGVSYVPSPADLTSPAVGGMSDGLLVWAIVNGTGHEPVLNSTVALERRWHIVNFLRTLGPRRDLPATRSGRPAAARETLALDKRHRGVRLALGSERK